MRITTVTGKITYVVGAFGLILAVNFFFISPNVNPTVDVLIVAVLNVGYVLVGTRAFRGARENRDDPRPWWRATAGPAAGIWIGGALAVLAFISGVGALSSKPENSFVPTVACIGYAALAAFYLHSSYRLRMLDVAP